MQIRMNTTWLAGTCLLMDWKEQRCFDGGCNTSPQDNFSDTIDVFYIYVAGPMCPLYIPLTKIFTLLTPWF